MSDPMTNAEVEDVLSSIRRLVSEEKPVEPEAPKARPQDRLVLTPALRVPDQPDAAQEEDFPDDTSSGQPSDEPPVFEGSEPDPFDCVSDDAKRHDDFVYAEPEEGQAESTYVLETPALGEQKDVQTTAVEEDVASDDAFEEWTSSPTAEFDDPQGSFGRENQTEEPEWPTEFNDVAIDNAEGEAEHTEPEAAPEPDSSTLSDKIAALETLIARRTDEWEPDDAGTDAYAGTESPAIAWEDADADMQPTFTSHREQPPTEDVNGVVDASSSGDPEEEHQAPLLAGQDEVLDEEALRELVSEIVRTELQGALGERITRNVRKLVRREIHRALTLQDLE